MRLHCGLKLEGNSMSFLDNLENNLKNMESREERTTARRPGQDRRESEQARARAAAPHLERLRKGAFTSELMGEATRIGHGLRTKVYMMWLDNTLRLEAREHRLELRATPDGVVARFLEDGRQTGEERVDLTTENAKKLAERWLKRVGPRPQVSEVHPTN
jgi:hypothetical protein